MITTLPPIAQILRNFSTNLSTFPPQGAGPAAVHRFFLDFYQRFAQAAAEIPETEQSRIIERIHKTLWAFARFGAGKEDGGVSALEIERAVIAKELKFPRAEEAFALLGRLGVPVELLANGLWSAAGKLKPAEKARLRFDFEPLPPAIPLARAFPDLAAQILAGKPKTGPAFERFLRADPHAILAGEKPPLALPADARAILA
ncbi:MAG: hypothetical protein IH586_11810, partial [Anaerolineaceae bacterium]|nr:hypothetical protein [Anaerolineaceae bacterium]